MCDLMRERKKSHGGVIPTCRCVCYFVFCKIEIYLGREKNCDVPLAFLVLGKVFLIKKKRKNQPWQAGSQACRQAHLEEGGNIFELRKMSLEQ